MEDLIYLQKIVQRERLETYISNFAHELVRFSGKNLANGFLVLTEYPNKNTYSGHQERCDLIVQVLKDRKVILIIECKVEEEDFEIGEVQLENYMISLSCRHGILMNASKAQKYEFDPSKKFKPNMSEEINLQNNLGRLLAQINPALIFSGKVHDSKLNADAVDNQTSKIKLLSDIVVGIPGGLVFPRVAEVVPKAISTHRQRNYSFLDSSCIIFNYFGAHFLRGILCSLIVKQFNLSAYNSPLNSLKYLITFFLFSTLSIPSYPLLLIIARNSRLESLSMLANEVSKRIFCSTSIAIHHFLSLLFFPTSLTGWMLSCLF
ncbi:hypothetical protein CONCODRAFT_19345 [Conidiobolus coronatus NRRL 28638]|uniref:Uncharacterized protein n=1 Tax=Conidiobolus coronatus (strain ATCC 28846 / CBS 209.66 / NRRL 28638) TaxID=796925 RepID=A0A137NYK7_CONC2|nr:hypothetical protein CONCODRAFT_19345 [Conidiobolus coronatus NRRL 28638]|eukprot:KXN67856.1 hypothetical protein CONCODRAFT_19345 [Conidiobolus coronatus NRRL 28638]